MGLTESTSISTNKEPWFDYEGHSMSMVSRIAEALERQVRVQLVGKTQ